MAMTQFSGWQYLLIDLANAFGHDKEVFEARIKWAEENMEVLEALTEQADTKPLYVKALMGIRKAQAGLPSGHLVGFDATCSGIQVMSALTGCIAGATSVGLVDPNVRADAYTLCTKVMNEILAAQGLSVEVTRKQAKSALMTAFYGSTGEPKKLFGEDTPELEAFYQAAATIAPGPWELLQDLLGSWQDGALEHCWTLPDGFQAKVKVMKKFEDVRIEVDELDHASFTYTYYENEGKIRGKDDGTKSNAANVVHSIDAYVLRSIHRRCNYDVDVMVITQDAINMALNQDQQPENADEAVRYYVAQYERSGMPDGTILSHLNHVNVLALSKQHLQAIKRIVDLMLEYKPFPVITIHDEFKCHPNHMNQLRKHYVEIFGDIADCNMLSGIFSEIYGQPITFVKQQNNLGDLIRQSNYALC